MTWQRRENTQTKGKASKIQHIPADSLILVHLAQPAGKKTDTKRDVLHSAGIRILSGVMLAG